MYSNNKSFRMIKGWCFLVSSPGNNNTLGSWWTLYYPKVRTEVQIRLANQKGKEQRVLSIIYCLHLTFWYIFTSPHMPTSHVFSQPSSHLCWVVPAASIFVSCACSVYVSSWEICAQISCHNIVFAHALASQPKSFNLASSNAFKNDGGALECAVHSNISCSC